MEVTFVMVTIEIAKEKGKWLRTNLINAEGKKKQPSC